MSEGSPTNKKGQTMQRKNEIGQRVKELRVALGLSQRELAAPGVSYAYISRIEAGTRAPSVKALRKLAAKLGVTPEYLERGNDWTTSDETLQEIVGKLVSSLVVEISERGFVVRWRRLYPIEPPSGGSPLMIDSDERMLSLEGEPGKRPGLTEAFRLVLDYEAEADRLDAEAERLAEEKVAHEQRLGHAILEA